ncbi:cytochrome P450 [Pseudonocardia sp. GCM10023141]|uniref:cytochrome P450 n=1 Tax=Pseudonocardia sp. GCM10023141 TaxID=3252653 RepID=UPI00360AEB26
MRTSDPLPPASVPERARDPHRWFAQRRAAGPVFLLDEPGCAEPTAVIVDGNEVVRALSDDAYSVAGNVSWGRTRPTIPLQIDPPEHERYRRYLDPLLRRAEMSLLMPRIEQHARELLDRIEARGRCEFVTDFARPLPVTIFLTLLGVPTDDVAFLLEFKDSVTRPHGDTVEARRALQEHWAQRAETYFAERLDAARRHGNDGLIGRLLVAEVDGVRLTDDELLDVCYQLALGGLDTVTATMGLIWAYLATHDEHRRQLATDPGTARLAVEELLRWATPVTGCKRRAVRDVDVAGCPISGGQVVMFGIASANSDPALFDDPDTVDFTRRGNRHWAFGGGIHRCLGSHLARLELVAAVQAWHARIPEYRLAEPDLDYTDGNVIRAVTRLELVW